MALKDDPVREDEEEALREFLTDSECLEPLSKWTRRFNVFDVLKITNTEIRHSNVLAWLMDPAENHGLHDGVIRGFVDYVARRAGGDGTLDDLLMDCDGFSIRREWCHIDILAVNEKEKYVLCVENKIFSGEHDDQLARYRSEVEREFPAYRQRFVFLTPGPGKCLGIRLACHGLWGRTRHHRPCGQNVRAGTGAGAVHLGIYGCREEEHLGRRRA